mmetsp:Transcript_2211/g.2570  ORF Transcript_2211/g.2570 Transcript_2211/m.2570 type:complete len:90 (-) Transcript_2211:322-591(-)
MDASLSGRKTMQDSITDAILPTTPPRDSIILVATNPPNKAIPPRYSHGVSSYSIFTSDNRPNGGKTHSFVAEIIEWKYDGGDEVLVKLR